MSPHVAARTLGPKGSAYKSLYARINLASAAATLLYLCLTKPMLKAARLMYEQSKAAKRRVHIPAFMTRYFVGEGLDIGAGPDGLSRYVAPVFPLLRSVRDWDTADGDAQYLGTVKDEAYNFVHASHCLEHMRSPAIALHNWLRVVKPGGYVIITVPDEDMYERGTWPSIRNGDHKWSFTAAKTLENGWSPVSINVTDIMRDVIIEASVERMEVLRDFFNPADSSDQTLGPVAECAIEFVLRKRLR